MQSVVAKPARSLFQTNTATAVPQTVVCLPELSEQGQEFLRGLNEIVEEHLPPGEHFWSHGWESSTKAVLSV